MVENPLGKSVARLKNGHRLQLPNVYAWDGEDIATLRTREKSDEHAMERVENWQDAVLVEVGRRGREKCSSTSKLRFFMNNDISTSSSHASLQH